MKTTNTKRIVIFTSLLIPLFPGVTLGVPGKLDKTFNYIGRVLTPIGISEDSAAAIALQSDGRILVAGKSFNGSNSDFAIARYLPNGILDSTFGSMGRVTTDIGGFDDAATGLALYSDGRIVVAGTSSDGVYGNMAIVRYLPNGTVDPAFGTAGKLIFDFGFNDEAGAVATMPDDRVIVVGSAFDVPPSGGAGIGILTPANFITIRLNSAGSPDPAFGNAGIVNSGFPSGQSSDVAKCVFVHTDGRIMVGGTTDGSCAMIRLKPDGAPDLTFNGTGQLAFSNKSLSKIAVQKDGKIIVASGSYPWYSLGGWAGVMRLGPDGILDPTFNFGGTATFAPPGVSNARFSSVAVQDDGKILMAGQCGASDFLTVRYHSNGILDKTFNGSGWVITDLGSSTDSASDIAVQPNGRIVVAGTANGDIAVTRLLNSQPDMLGAIGAAGALGGNIYSLDGTGQTLATGIRRNGFSKTATIIIQNDGPVSETFRLEGTRGDSRFELACFVDGRDVTTRLVTGSYFTKRLAPGATERLVVRITARTKLPGQRKNLLFSAVSTADATAADRMKITVRSL